MRATTTSPDVIVPQGAFDLRQSIDFSFGPRGGLAAGADVLRLGMVLDDLGGQAGVAVRQQPDGVVRLEASVVRPGGTAGPVPTQTAEAVRDQVARVLSLDVDATGWDTLCAGDPLLGRLQGARPGLRPPLFCSAYEALCWSVLSARRPRAQMAALQAALSREHGAVVDVAGEPVPVFPIPEQLLAVEAFPGLPEQKLHRLHALARAALDGRLDTARLRALEPEQARAELQRHEGIGPFYSELVTVRTLGHTDVLPSSEPRVLAIAGELLGRGRPLTVDELSEAAEPWRPWRTWAAVALRAAGERLLARAA